MKSKFAIFLFLTLCSITFQFEDFLFLSQIHSTKKDNNLTLVNKSCNKTLNSNFNSTFSLNSTLSLNNTANVTIIVNDIEKNNPAILANDINAKKENNKLKKKKENSKITSNDNEINKNKNKNEKKKEKEEEEESTNHKKKIIDLRKIK
jgi:hypothetical protein